RTAGHYDVAWSFAGNDNYNGASGTSTIDITPRTLHVSATGVNKVYDGTTAAAVTLSDDRVAGDTETVTYTTALCDTRDVGTGKTVTVGGISIFGFAAANYHLVNTTATTNADITPLPLTGSITAASKVYDGTTAATITSRSVVGVINGDAVSYVGGTAA